MNCLSCGKEQEDENYRYCGIECQILDWTRGVQMSEPQIPNELETWQDFFNYEARRITELTEIELVNRIKQYSKLLVAVKAFQHASDVRLKDIAKDERYKVLQQDLRYVPPTVVHGKQVSKAEKVSKHEKAIQSMMKLLNMTREEALGVMNHKYTKENKELIEKQKEDARRADLEEEAERAARESFEDLK